MREVWLSEEEKPANRQAIGKDVLMMTRQKKGIATPNRIRGLS